MSVIHRDFGKHIELFEGPRGLFGKDDYHKHVHILRYTVISVMVMVATLIHT